MGFLKKLFRAQDDGWLDSDCDLLMAREEIVALHENLNEEAEASGGSYYFTNDYADAWLAFRDNPTPNQARAFMKAAPPIREYFEGCRPGGRFHDLNRLLGHITKRVAEKTPDDVIMDIVSRYLQTETVAAEYNRRPPDQQKQFMMAYAGYLMWLAKVAYEQERPTGQVETMVRSLHSRFASEAWYESGVFESIWEELQDMLPHMKPGPTFGVLIPLTWIVMAANAAGCKLDQSSDPAIAIESTMVMKEFLG